MSVICGTCLPGPNCLTTDDVNLYSLDNKIFPIVLNCPPGFDCFGNLLDAGTLTMDCCGTTIVRNFAAGLTVQQVLAIINQMVTQCASYSAFCSTGGGPPSTPNQPIQIYFNHAANCTLICPDGDPFTATVNPGLFIGFTQSSADSQAGAAACRLAKSNIICLSDLTTTEFCANSALSITIKATGNSLAQYPFTDWWGIVGGSLPSGLTFNGGDIQGGVVTITGTPTVGGSFSFTVQVVAPNGSYQTKTYTICVVDISPSSSTLPAGTVGVAYSQTFTATSCAITPYSWQLSSGSLPPGITLDEETGNLTGTPATAGTYNFTIRFQDAAT